VTHTDRRDPDKLDQLDQLEGTRVATHSTWWVIEKTPMVLRVSAILCRQLRSREVNRPLTCGFVI
jgi:hypothetical protein